MATLKISDLSVGDWVGIDQAELNMPSDDLATAYIEKLRKPIRIKGISEDSDMVIADIEIVDEWGSIMMKCEHLSPIPITAEMLEKNGWLFHKNNRWWVCQIDKDTRANVWLGENGGCRVEVSVMYGESRTWSNYADVKLANAHIHLLQGVLRLAGVDKEIDL